MIKRWGIRGRVLAIAVVPAALLSLFLGFFFTQSRITDLDDLLQDQGRAIVRHLASASEYGVFAGNTELLHGLAESTARETEVRGVAIYDTDGHPLATAGSFAERARMPPTDLEMKQDLEPSVQLTGDMLLVRGAILLGSIAIEDFPESSAPEASPPGRRDLLGWVLVELDRHETVMRQRVVMRHGMLIVVLGLIACGLLAWRMGRNVSGPIVELTDGVKRLKSGSLEHRVHLRAGAELGSLATGINAMAQELETKQQELQTRIDHATRALQDRNIELEQAQKAALAASEAKSAFLASMSHEIRTPISVVIGFTDHLLKTDLGRDQLEFADKIRLSATSLLSIINDVLDFSKIEAGKLVLMEAPFDLEECLEEVFTMLAPTAHKKGLELAVLIYEDVPRRMIGDVGRLRQILVNLVANAIKFTDRGGVDVIIEMGERDTQGPGVRIAVRDTGIGISDQDRRRLFSAFTQVGNGVRRGAGGTGLGLAIVRELVTLIGGTMHEVQSTPGQGSTFALTVPCPVQEPADEGGGNDELLAGVLAVVWEPQPLPRLALCTSLESLGAEVTVPEVRPTPETLPAAPAGQRQILFLGLSKAELAATETAESVRALAARLPVLVLASATDPAAWAHVIDQGATSYLSKPVLRRQLTRRLRDVFAPKQAAQRDKDTAEPGGALGAEPLDGKRVLLADDNQTSARVVEVLLHHWGAAVSIARDGLTALQRVRTGAFDLVLMDLQMPVMDGIEAIREIRALGSPAALVPIIALTALATDDDRRQVLAAGADDCLFKPLTESRLRRTLNRLLPRESNRRPPRPEADCRDTPASATTDELCTRFLSELPRQRDGINEAYRDGDLAAMQRRVHRVHGAMCYCRVPALAQATAALEHALRAGSAVDELLGRFNAEIERALPASVRAGAKS